MNDLKTIHTDILIIMIDDVNQRVRAGELSDIEYSVQIAPLNSELYERAVTLFNDAMVRDEQYRRLSEMAALEAANSVKQIYESFAEYKIKIDREIYEYLDFLKDKQLEEDFGKWHNERIKKQIDSAAGKGE